MPRPTYICQLCRLSRFQRRAITNLRLTTAPFKTGTRAYSQPAAIRSEQSIVHREVEQPEQKKPFWGTDWTVFSADNAALVKQAQTLGTAILSDQSIPVEEEVLKALEFIKFAALQLNAVQVSKKTEAASKERRKEEALEQAIFAKQKPRSHGVTAGLLSDIQVDTGSGNAVSVAIAAKLLSTLAYKIAIHPPVFITPKILESYVAIQISLNQLSTLPEVFDLYAHKPVPRPESSPIEYVDPNPNKPTQAVPEQLANRALEAALKEKQLTLSLDIISSTFCMTAFRRNKFIRKALPLVGSLALTPFVIAPLAQQWASTSLAADTRELAIFATVGMLTYVGTLSSLGYIAITTYNDQMERVTWMPGMPLRDRWLREEERAAVDKVVLSWGFKEVHMRGQEEGDEWDLLQEWTLRRGMLIDSSELLDGME